MLQRTTLRFSSPSVLRLLWDCSSGSILLVVRSGLMNFKNWDMVRERKIALLIDAENISHQFIGQVMASVRKTMDGLITVKRIYADWTKPNLSAWKAVLRKYALMPIQQYSFSSGKNSSDFALVIDAMDLLYQSDIDVFYIVSSDSDFTRLVMRIRESGKIVIGMGEKKALESFVLACNDYIFFEENGDTTSTVSGSSDFLEKAPSQASFVPSFSDTSYSVSSVAASFVVSSTASSDSFSFPGGEGKIVEEGMEYSKEDSMNVLEPSSSSLKSEPLSRDTGQYSAGISKKLLALLRQVVKEVAENDGWAELGCVANRLHERRPDFKAKSYGYSRFLKLIEACESSFLIDRNHQIKRKTKTLRKVCLKNR